MNTTWRNVSCPTKLDNTKLKCLWEEVSSPYSFLQDFSPPSDSKATPKQLRGQMHSFKNLHKTAHKSAMAPLLLSVLSCHLVLSLACSVADFEPFSP